MEVSVLGPVSLIVDDRVVPLRGLGQRALLTRLAVARGDVVPRDELIADVWDGVPPSTAPATLQAYVRQLRTRLGSDRALLVTRGGGYALELDPDALDVSRFEHLVEQAHEYDDDARAGYLQRALSLWRGPAFGELADREWARGYAARLEALRIVAHEERIDALLAAGRHAQAVPELEALVDAHPSCERFWLQLILSLYRSGRQADGLLAYRRVRERLGAELGIEPSRELTNLEQAVIDHDPRLDWRPDRQQHVGALPSGVVTFLLTDVENSTAQWDADPAAMALALVKHDELLAEVVNRHSGVILKARGEGDSVFAVFVRATQGVAAALEVQDRLSAGVQVRTPLVVRIAVHTGEALERDGDYFGPTVNRAARIRSLAHGGEILLSQSTVELVQDKLLDVELIDTGSRELRGLSRPERVFVLRRVEPSSAGPSTRPDPVPPRPAQPPALLLPEPETFVGRAPELSHLRRLWGAASAGRLEIAILEGEAGIGKTSLAARFAGECSESGVALLIGRSTQDRLVPYQPFVEALSERCVTAAAPGAPLDLGPGTEALLHLVPTLAPHVRSSDPTLQQLGREQYWLFEAFTAFLKSVTREQQLLLVIDDLQWVDQSSLLLLAHLAVRLRTTRALIIGTVRDELERRHPVRTALAELQRVAHPAWIPLTGLSPNEIASFAGVDRRVAWAIYRLTDGNPFFVDEIVNHLREQGCLDEASLGALDLPRGAREMIEARLSRLPEDEVRVLRSAAVLGEEFELGVLARTVEQPEDQLVDRLDHALAARLIIEDERDERADSYRFSHALLRQALYESLSAVRRRRLHVRAANAIEEIHGDDIRRFLPELAAHCRAAGAAVPVERAIDLSVRAGSFCREALAYTEASEHWASALALLPQTPAADRHRARLHEMLGQLLFSTGVDRNGGLEHLVGSLELLERLDDRPAMARLHCRLGQSLASLPAFMDIASALDHYRSARAVLEDRPSPGLASHLYVGLSAAALYSLDNAEGLDAASRAIESVHSTGAHDAPALARALHGAHRAYQGDIAEGFAEVEQAWATADASGDPITSFFAAWMRGWGAVLLLNPCDAHEWFRRELDTERIDSMPRNRSTLQAMCLICDLLTGLPDRDDADIDPAADAPLYLPLLTLRRGDWDHALEQLGDTRESLARAGNRADECTIAYWLGHLHALRGDRDAAVAVLSDGLVAPRSTAGAPPCHDVLLRSELARLGVESEVNIARSHESMRYWAGHGLAGRVALAEATTAASEGAPESQVDARFRSALNQFRALELRWDEAETLTEWALAHERARKPHDAERARAAAGTLYRSIGADGPWIERVEAFV